MNFNRLKPNARYRTSECLSLFRVPVDNHSKKLTLQETHHDAYLFRVSRSIDRIEKTTRSINAKSARARRDAYTLHCARTRAAKADRNGPCEILETRLKRNFHKARPA